MFVLFLNSYIEILTPLEGRDFEEWLYHEGAVLMNRISAFIRKDPDPSAFSLSLPLSPTRSLPLSLIPSGYCHTDWDIIIQMSVHLITQNSITEHILWSTYSSLTFSEQTENIRAYFKELYFFRWHL